MVSSKVSCHGQMFPVSLVQNRRRNLGNFRRNAALDAGFSGFLLWKQFPRRKHGSFLNVSSHGARIQRRSAMSLTAVSRCLQCHAVVNVHWTACLVCKALLPMVPADPPRCFRAGKDSQPSEACPHSAAKPGWLVVYRDQTGKLRGGADEREHGTVKECRWQRAGWVLS